MPCANLRLMSHFYRYDTNPGLDERHPLVRTISIPSPILQKHKLEILAHAVNLSIESTREGAAELLVPSLDTANSANGRSSKITYPVHKALLYAEGFEGLGVFTTLQRQADRYRGDKMFKAVIDWSWSIAQQQNKATLLVSPINLPLAENAIETFRGSIDKSLDYEHLWFDAGMPALSEWLIEGTEGQAGALKQATRRLIEMLGETATQGIDRDAAAKLLEEKNATVPSKIQSIISQGISIWAENAHTELRDRLNSAYNGRDWKKTKWWKLFWRVDTVGYTAMDILKRAWLIEAEKEMIWLCGRIHESGLIGPPKARPKPAIDPENEEQQIGGRPPAPSIEDLVSKSNDFNEPLPVEHPWPQGIARARSTLATLIVPPLQALSQALLLQTLTTNVLASSLSALVFFSISTTSPYESGAIATSGLVYSLRRLQKRWETARDEWEAEVREEGRRVLQSMEALMREAVEEYKPEVDSVAAEERAIAKKAVRNVRTALEAHKV